MAKNDQKDDRGENVTWETQCLGCKHLLNIGKQFDNERWTCKAYPEGIPYGVWKNHQIHNEVLGFPYRQVGKFIREQRTK